VRATTRVAGTVPSGARCRDEAASPLLSEVRMRKHLPAILIAALAASMPAAAQQSAASSVAVGSDVRAKVTYCTEESEANNVLLAHRDSGLAAGVDYIVHSPVCRVAVLRFTVLRELAAYPDLPLERGQPARTFYVIEAVDAAGERLYIVSMVKVVDRVAEG